MGYNDAMLAKLVSSGLNSTRGLDHYIVRTEEQREAIFRLRYEAYFNEGFIGANKEGVLFDKYDLEDSSHVYGVNLRGRLVSTIRLNVLDNKQRKSSSYDLFSDYLDPFLDGGKTVVDGTRLAVRCDNTALRRKVLLYTLSLTALFASKNEIDVGAIAVRDSHVPFYQRYGFHVLGEPRIFDGIKQPRTLMATKLGQVSEHAQFLGAQYSSSSWDSRLALREVMGF